ncbi:androgen-dependent TFPI-regulating protein-like [Trichoplusia ni]|uniref:Androgen-dependent TFPI-regulating protein-like n=1 Tax=Trichoplusia ni TaxID=7111 RepID=A0A7E5WPB0_TRINI|nr:androgen-dependent TFPI-regulating protein-like [Trichoplusia ni]
MLSPIHYRLLGQTVALALHAGNSVVMFKSMLNQELLRDHKIRDMVSLQSRYLTVWNIAFQLFYFGLAFACDFTTVTGRESLIPKSVRHFRQRFYAAVVFPVAVLIFVIFWPIFIYDRELLFPAFIDKIFSFESNLVMHFCILPAAVWELAFLQRPVPKSHKINFGIITLINIVYNALVVHTYLQRGLFPYPILYMIFGTIFYPILVGIVYVAGLGIYLYQWKLTTFFWGQEKKKSKPKRK